MTDNVPPRARSGWTVVFAVSGVLAAVAIAGVLFMQNQQRRAAPEDAPAPTEEYGRRLITETAWLLGPDQPNQNRRFMASRLNCGSCHLDAGTRPGTLSLTETFQRYPRPSGRDGKEGDLKERIDGCMERSMNGRKLPRDSVEMDAMVAYIRSVSEHWMATSPDRRVVMERAAFRPPARAASPEAGRIVFESRCQVCHGPDGHGLPASTDPRRGYLFPPLWGNGSFNDGAGMGRVLTAAKFIKARMPFGRPDLTDDEAFDVAAYVNSQPRPQMSADQLEQDYPDRSTKPVDAPYGPYADPFPQQQHKFGPFAPIEAFYKKK